MGKFKELRTKVFGAREKRVKAILKERREGKEEAFRASLVRKKAARAAFLEEKQKVEIERARVRARAPSILSQFGTGLGSMMEQATRPPARTRVTVRKRKKKRKRGIITTTRRAKPQSMNLFSGGDLF